MTLWVVIPLQRDRSVSSITQLCSFGRIVSLWLVLGISAVRAGEEIQTCSLVEATCREGHVPAFPCVDEDSRCRRWALNGACHKNAAYMADHCRRSCDFCTLLDTDSVLGVPQLVNAKLKLQAESKLRDAIEYLTNTVANEPALESLLPKCRNYSNLCSYYAVSGVCESNPNWTRRKCAPLCHSCEYLSVETLCPYVPDDMPSAWKPGDVNRFFTNLTTLTKFEQHDPQVWSRPDYLPGDTNETARYHLGPWVVVLDNVMTDEEAKRMIELGSAEGYHRSADAGALKEDGTNGSYYHGGRTSSNTWCENTCYRDPVSQRVLQRVTNITNIPETNSEYWQLLKYDVGQFYQVHHDYGGLQRERAQGVRILTVFLYLNDVEEGGGTNFPQLNITVLPRRGRALVWPSVLNENPDEVDPRTEHQALPVIRGVKYGANAWIHQRDYKGPYHKGCTSFIEV